MTPDWRALVAEAGADPDALRIGTFRDGACLLRLDGFEVQAWRAGKWFWAPMPGGKFSDPLETPAEAIHAALNHLRAELRARMERDAAALRRLGGGE